MNECLVSCARLNTESERRTCQEHEEETYEGEQSMRPHRVACFQVSHARFGLPSTRVHSITNKSGPSTNG